MTTGDAPISARELLESGLKAARRKEIVAFTMPTFQGATMFVNLPLGEPGPAYGWVGHWLSEADLMGQMRPSMVIATARRHDKDDVQRLVRLTHGLPHMRTREIDGIAVIIASNSVWDVDAPVQRVQNPEPLNAMSFAFATQGLDD